MTKPLTKNMKTARNTSVFTCICLFLSIKVIINFLSINPVLAQRIVRNITIDRGINPNSLLIEGISGGSIAALEVAKTEQTSTGYCDGFVNRQPNHILTLKNFFDFLKIEVDSLTDTTIVVRGPGGIWCNDDSYSMNPIIEGQWQPGVYKIWIGSYQENSTDNYRIRISGR